MKEHVSRIRIEWSHCDAAGIVFYPNFYIWFDQGTERLFTANGLSYRELEEDLGISGMPLLESGANYRRPCKLGDTVELTSWVDEWAGRTFVVKHRIVHADGETALEGFERRAFVTPDPDSPKGMRAVAAPEDVIERFAG